MLVHEFLERSAARFPNKTALVVGNKRFTYKSVDGLADRLAEGLIARGMKRRDRVVILMDNSLEAVVSIFGVLKAGGIFVVLNPAMKAKKLAYILQDSSAGFLVTQPGKSRVVREAVPQTENPPHIVWCGTNSPPDLDEERKIKTTPWKDLFEDPGRSKENGRVRPIDIDLAAIIYTSGSTGDPKGVMSTHHNIFSAATSITEYLENTPEDIIFTALPLSFDYGLYQVLMAFLFGGTVVLEWSFAYPHKVVERLIEERATGFPIVPTVISMLLKMDDLSKFDFRSLRYITNTAAALPVPHIRKLRKIFPHVSLYSMYGLTECKRVSYLPPRYIDRKPGSVGIPIPNEEVFVVDGQGRELPPGETGELVVRGANVMQGYWNAPEQTAKTFKTGRYPSETLLYTGDLFRRDADGFLYFVSRKDDLIKTKGERVSPREIENMLCELEEIVEAAVIGVPDDMFGQAILAYIVTSEGSSLTKNRVGKYCTMNLEPFMVPKYIRFVDCLPRSSSGKVDRKKLFELYEKGRENEL